MLTKNLAVAIGAALLAGLLGALLPGCYADWDFVRSARLQQQTRLEQQLKALAEENQKLKQAKEMAK